MMAGVTDWWRFPTYKEFIVMIVICRIHPVLFRVMLIFLSYNVALAESTVVSGYKKPENLKSFSFSPYKNTTGKPQLRTPEDVLSLTV
jgi:hypothetical protein